MNDPNPARTTTDYTILWVEDEIGIREMVERILRNAGYKVLVARNATEALDLYRVFIGKIDLIISDLIMPGMNAVEMYTLLQQVAPISRFLICSGHIDSEMRRSLDAVGIYDFISKPFRLPELLDMVAGLLAAK